MKAEVFRAIEIGQEELRRRPVAGAFQQVGMGAGEPAGLPQPERRSPRRKDGVVGAARLQARGPVELVEQTLSWIKAGHGDLHIIAR